MTEGRTFFFSSRFCVIYFEGEKKKEEIILLHFKAYLTVCILPFPLRGTVYSTARLQLAWNSNAFIKL